MIAFLKSRIRSFRCAIRGILTLVATQPHARIHLLATFIVTAAGLKFHLRRWEWVAVLLCIGMVWMAEALNTSLEFLADEISPEYRERIGRAKDTAAGGVLIAAVVSAIVASLVFMNHLH